jgi:hypothetical protein
MSCARRRSTRLSPVVECAGRVWFLRCYNCHAKNIVAWGLVIKGWWEEEAADAPLTGSAAPASWAESRNRMATMQWSSKVQNTYSLFKRYFKPLRQT